MATKKGRKKAPVPVLALRTTARLRGSSQVLSPVAARQIERRYKVMEMRRQGFQIQDIAKALGCAANTVSEDLREVLGLASQEMLPTEMDRALEHARFDRYLETISPLAEAGNLNAMGMALSISDRRRKLLALDKPEQKHQGDMGLRVYIGVNVDDV